MRFSPRFGPVARRTFAEIYSKKIAIALYNLRQSENYSAFMIGKEVTVWTASSDVSPLVLAPSRRSSTTGVGLVSGTLHLLTTGRRSLGQLISLQGRRCSLGWYLGSLVHVCGF